MSHTLLLEGVSKRYSGHTAVDNLSLAVPPGTIYGILGPNGAGKSTTLRMVMNIIIRDSGTISLLGADPEKDRSVLRRVGFLPEERGLYKKMTVLDVIVFFAQIKGVEVKQARAEAGRWLERMSLGDWRGAKVETLSKGMQQKVQFIATVIHQPELLILDEPQSGLDPVNQEVLRDTILQHRKDGKTVIFSTHNMEQAEQLCEHVCIIAQGRKVLDGRLRDIRRENMGNAYRVQFEGESPAAEAFMAAGRFGAAAREGEEWRLELAPGTDTRALLAALNDLDAPLVRFQREEPSLHDIFVSRVAGAAQTRRVEVAHV
ncbi:MAG TPA: ATP-binding cassette domain-containing protein [Longimicrobium sp.]|jgi:ABC-2 type transport system ATP-binding protein